MSTAILARDLSVTSSDQELPMPVITKHAPGAFCWAEVATVNVAKTKAFYSELFGWTYADQPAGQFGTYTMVRQGGHDLAGLYELPPNLRKMGVPSHWMSYIAVADANAAAAKIKQHGGVVQQGPFDVMKHGRMAICQDPTGATFSIWQPLEHCGASVMGENGTCSWFELATKGVEKAEAFYKAVFGWSVKVGNDSGMVYRELTPPGARSPQGGMMELTPHHGPVPPHWLIYFTVNDCDGDVARAQALGGKVLAPPMDIPKVGRFAVLADPAGAAFALIKLAFDPSQGHEHAAPATSKPAAKAAKKKGK
jgi:predicted enzyme related to lactoylglutathione lyase